MLMGGHPNGCILDQRASGAHMQITCRRPVPNYYSCLQTYISWDRPQNQLHTRWANNDCSRVQEWTWIYSWRKEPIHTRGPTVSPLPPRGADIYEDIPSKIIIIALPFQAATTCVMIAFVALPSLRPTRPPSHWDTALPPPPPHPLYPANVTRQGEGKCRPACPLGCVESRLAAARFTPVLHSQSDSIHHPPWGLSRSYSPEICRWKRMNV